MNIAPETHVAKIATRHPGTIRVFQRHGIDFCCGGGRPLAEACTEIGLDWPAFSTELAEAAGPSHDDDRDWSEAPLAELVDHILTRYHARLGEDLPRLAAMADKVLSVHGEKHPDVLPALAQTVHRLRAELEDHMAKEEMILFPYVKQMEEGGGTATPFGSVAGPIEAMEAEHDEAAHLLRRLRELTQDFEPPRGACTTFRGLYHGLAELEADTHRHIHLENNVLFPRAAEMEGAF
jgi:regulator of cell morphogenesis and NO signaling